VQLKIVGDSPRSILKKIAKKDSSIILTGRVPSISDALNQSIIAIAPMQSGSGMQFKILEAMACAIPVVTTTLGLGDIKAMPGKEIVIADDPLDFSNAVIRLLESEDLCNQIGDLGRSYSIRNHNWKHLNQKFFDNINNCL
jgi:glycosyltransferase involved in cell wall biosynthesis